MSEHRRRFSMPRFAPELIRDLREEAGMSQQEFAEAIGCSITTLARWETNRPPSLEAVFKLLPWAIRHRHERSAAAIAAVLEDELEGTVKLIYGETTHA